MMVRVHSEPIHLIGDQLVGTKFYNRQLYDFLTELEEFIELLDSRWTGKSALKKPRVASTPLVCRAPKNAPGWAVRRSDSENVC